MTRTALLTGITGFIGAHVAERLLADGWRVHAIVRPQSDVGDVPPNAALTLHKHDGSTEALVGIVGAARPDVVFHLASLFLADHRADQVEPLIASNLLFPAQLLEAMVAGGVRRIVDTGTAWQHFEGDRYRPVNLYAATKQAAQDILAYYADVHAISAVTLKLFDTYGPGDRRRKLIRILVDAARSGEPLDMSPGAQIVDLTHVDDVTSAFLIAADRLLASATPLHEAFFVSGERCTVRQLVDTVAVAIDRPLHVNFGGRPYRAREVMTPIEPRRSDRLAGWTARRTLLASLPSLMDE